jgi:hypothetical protein
MISLLVIVVVYSGCWILVKLARKLDNRPKPSIDEVRYYYAQDEQGQAFLREYGLAYRYSS